jgi:hypothetical protein
MRVEIYRWFTDHGSAPDPTQLVEILDSDLSSVREGLSELAQARQIVLGENFQIVMAHPFSAIPLGFSVMGSATLWWGGCSWDSFALPNLIAATEPLLVATSCPNCERALAWNVSSAGPPEGKELAHFLVPTANMWDDVVHTCGNQRIFCSQGCIDSWLLKTGNKQGYVMDLETLWGLASGWYRGRLEKGYVRREPSAAKDYFRKVGLSGPFWGLD